jgi:hypothetical protein
VGLLVSFPQAHAATDLFKLLKYQRAFEAAARAEAGDVLPLESLVELMRSVGQMPSVSQVRLAL